MAQGFAQAVYDLVGNEMILNLWSGISTSPINAMHAGYGIGAILAVQISKSYIVFSVYDSFLAAAKTNTSTSVGRRETSTTIAANETSTSWEKIDLTVPYRFSGIVAMLLALLFLIAQVYENKVLGAFDFFCAEKILINLVNRVTH